MCMIGMMKGESHQLWLLTTRMKYGSENLLMDLDNWYFSSYTVEVAALPTRIDDSLENFSANYPQKVYTNCRRTCVTYSTTRFLGNPRKF